jgi:hypothetical protein
MASMTTIPNALMSRSMICWLVILAAQGLKMPAQFIVYAPGEI